MSNLPPLRIAMVTSKYPPAIGGSEIATQRTARALARRGHTVDVITLAREGFPEMEQDSERMRVWRTIRPTAVGPLWGYTYMRQVRAELRRLGPFDVHHCRQVYLHTIAAVDVALETKAACVSTICSSGDLLDFKKLRELRFGDKLIRQATRFPSAFVALSREISLDVDRGMWLWDSTREHACPIETIPNGVDAEYFAPSLTAGSLPPHAVFVGRLVEVKNVAGLLSAFRIASEGIGDARLTIVGDGPLRGALEAQAKELGIVERVTFTGALADVRAALLKSGFAVSASRIEGMSNALLEQMSCGLSAIMPRAGGCEEVLTGFGGEVAGALYPTGDMDALAGEMRRMFESHELRGDCGERARRYILAHFSLEAVVKRLESYYRELIVRARSPRS